MWFADFATAFGISLRGQEQIAASLQAIVLNWPEKEWMHIGLILFYLILKQHSSPLFEQLANGPLSGADLKEKVGGLMNADHQIYLEYRNGSPVSMSTLDVISHYLQLTNTKYSALEISDVLMRKDSMRKDSMRDLVVISLVEGLPYKIRASNNLLPLSEYHDRVSRAGQLRMTDLS